MSSVDELLDRICLSDAINECITEGVDCSACDCVLREMIAKHDKGVKDKVIDEVLKIAEDLSFVDDHLNRVVDLDELKEEIYKLKESEKNEY